MEYTRMELRIVTRGMRQVYSRIYTVEEDLVVK